MSDSYGRSWEYRVVSELDREPDAANSGRRLLHIRVVVIMGGRLPAYPVPADGVIVQIESMRWSEPRCETIEALKLDLERRMAATDKPALILAEWRDYVQPENDAERFVD